MTIEQANLLDKYLTFKCKANGNTNYYLNVMNNNEDFSLKINPKDKNALNRQYHNCCNVTAIEYRECEDGFKDFSSGRKYYYVIFNRSATNSVDIRKDLIDLWARNNAKDRVIVVNTNNNLVWEYSMQDFFGKSQLSFQYRWNKDGNITQFFTLPEPAFTDNSPETIDNQTVVNYITKSWEYLGHVSYATHRRSSKMVMVAQYDSNGNRKKYHVMKSLSQVYDLLHFENLGCLRTFQRLFETGAVVSLFLTNEDGITYWVSTEEYLIPPEKVTDDKSEDGLVKETVVDADADTHETFANIVTNVELDLRKEKDLSVEKVTRKIIRVLEDENSPVKDEYTIVRSPLTSEQLKAFSARWDAEHKDTPLLI